MSMSLEDFDDDELSDRNLRCFYFVNPVSSRSWDWAESLEISKSRENGTP